MKHMKTVRRYGVGLALAVAAVSANAALPAGVDTAITGAGTDVQIALGLMITMAVGIWAVKKVYHLFGSR